MNHVLNTVLRVFYRLSQAKDSEDEYFSQVKYQELIYSNSVFDITKLYDIIAIYGHSNESIVQSIVTNVFENDKRFLADFKQGVDTIVTMLKKSFSACLRVSDMIDGQDVVERSRSEQDEIIMKIMLDFIEIMYNVELTTRFFPDELLEKVRMTSLPLFMANVFCLMKNTVKTHWMKDSLVKKQLNKMRK